MTTMGSITPRATATTRSNARRSPRGMVGAAMTRMAVVARAEMAGTEALPGAFEVAAGAGLGVDAATAAPRAGQAPSRVPVAAVPRQRAAMEPVGASRTH